jgi:hypothetical protein
MSAKCEVGDPYLLIGLHVYVGFMAIAGEGTLYRPRVKPLLGGGGVSFGGRGCGVQIGPIGGWGVPLGGRGSVICDAMSV